MNNPESKSKRSWLIRNFWLVTMVLNLVLVFVVLVLLVLLLSK